MLGSELCHIVIDMTTKTYEIRDVATGQIVFGQGSATTKEKLQEAARKRVFDCSARFLSELKPRKKK